jgi:hypothetical protein
VQPAHGQPGGVGLVELVESVPHVLLQLVGRHGRDLAEQLVAVGEVAVRRVVRHPRAPSHLPEHHPVGPGRARQLHTGGDQLGAEVAVVVGAHEQQYRRRC